MSKTFKIAIAVTAVAIAGGAYFMGQENAFAQMAHGQGMDHSQMHAQMHGNGAEVDHSAMGMPGLRGLDATDAESTELAVMFDGFQTMTRTVENLDNGIRTVTSSSDPVVMDALVSHVTGMINRVEEGRDPKIMVQSPTLDIFFMRGENLVNEIEITDEGIVVTQTTDDPELVKALHVHAGEVSRMAAGGMDALHEMMAERGSN